MFLQRSCLSRTWHSELETPATVRDATQYWVNKTLPAAKTNQETKTAFSYNDFEILLQRCEGLLQVLGVTSDVLLEVVRCVSKHNVACKGLPQTMKV